MNKHTLTTKDSTGGMMGRHLRVWLNGKEIGHFYRDAEDNAPEFSVIEKIVNSHDLLVDALNLHCVICVKMSGFTTEQCEKCVTTKALDAAGEEIE